MLGQEVMRAGFEAEYDMIGKTHGQLDIRNTDHIEQVLKKEKPIALINCAGIVKGKQLPDMEFYEVNSVAPIMMAQICEKCDVDMVQISTDCVFKGDAGPYSECSKITADDTYGMSKALGELNNEQLTIRCSFIGQEGGLLKWLTGQQGNIPGFINFKWNGLVVHRIAQEIIYLLSIETKGLIHIYGHDTTKYDVLKAANEVFELGLNIIPTDVPIIDHRLVTNRKEYNLAKSGIPDIKKQLEELKDAHSCNSCRA